MGIGKDFVSFLKDGNANYMRETQDPGDIDINFMHYREFSFGASKNFMNGRLSLEIKAKALFGKFTLQTEKLNFRVTTADDGSSVILNTDMMVNFVSPAMTPDYDEDNFFNGFAEDVKMPDYMLASGNVGMAFDIGAVYKVDQQLTVSASLVDIGKITFDTDAYNVNINDSYTWEGLDFSNSLNDNDPQYISGEDKIEQEMDKLGAVVRPKRENVNSGSFSATLPGKVFLAGNYILSDKINFGLLDRVYMFNGETKNAITLSANAMLKSFLSLTGTYSVINGSYDNPGLGIALRGGPLQFYMVNDNILALANPAKTNFVNIRFGLNLLFGRKESN